MPSPPPLPVLLLLALALGGHARTVAAAAHRPHEEPAVASWRRLARSDGAAECAAIGLQEWVHQLGSRYYDEVRAVAVLPGSGDIVVGGYTGGTLPGSPEPNAGSYDGFIAVYSADNGTRRWVHQFGSSSGDNVRAIAVNPGSGDIVVAGHTGGTLPGSPEDNANDGIEDAFIAVYTASGTRRWVRQLGSTSRDYVHAIALLPGSGDIVVGGSTGGTLPGSPEGNANAGNGYSHDGFIAVYTADGTTRRWVHHLGSSAWDGVNAVAVHPGSGDIVVGGYTAGTLPGSPERNAGGTDGFVAVYTAPTISAAAHPCFELVGDGNCRDANGANTARDSQERRPGSSLAVCIQSCIAMVGCTAVEYRRLETDEECELHTQEVATFDADSNRQCYRRLAPAVNGCPAESTQAPTNPPTPGPPTPEGGTLRWVRQLGTSSDDRV